MQRNPETLTTLCCSGTKHLFTSWLLVFRHEERETHNFYYADCSYIALSQPPPAELARPRVKSQLISGLPGPVSKSQLTDPTNAHPVAPSWTGLTQNQISTNSFFQKSLKFPTLHFRAWRHSHPSLISYLGILLWHLWLSYSLRASVNTGTKSRIVQSSTKPNDKI